MEKIIYIFDTSAFIKGMNVSVLEGITCYTTNSVVTEVRNSFSKQKINTALLTGNLKIQDPSPESISRVKIVAQNSGDLPFLSSTDIDVIALALSMQESESQNTVQSPSRTSVTVVSDDYSIQNILKSLSIPIHSFMKKGVSSYIQWQVYCPQCKSIYPKADKISCAKCGAKLKRRPVDKK